MHTSTSPQYAIIASCDVAAAMMEPPGGTALVEESIVEALDFRRAMRKVDDEWGKDWWFKVWGPDNLAEDGIGPREDWMLRANEKWHGFGNLAPGFNMLDPIKATVITPGLDVSGKFAQDRHSGVDRHQVPGRARRHRREDRAVLVLHHVHHRHHQGPLEHAGDGAAAVQGRLRQEPAAVAHPAGVLRAATRATSASACATCAQQIHDIYKANDVARVTTEMYLSDMQPAMKPSDAFACMAHREIDRVEIDELEGRVTGVLLTPYPPGIPLLIPGERFNRTIVEYLQFARDVQRALPGLRDRHPRPGGGGGRTASAATSWIACGNADGGPDSGRSRPSRDVGLARWPRDRRRSGERRRRPDQGAMSKSMPCASGSALP